VRVAVLCLALGLTTPLAGCAGPRLAHAVHAAEEGRFPDASVELIALERTLGRHSSAFCARYALERGLVHLAMGDLVAADFWLRIAWAYVDARPELLSAADRARLIAGWRATGRMPGER
jgi:hypothetical protein